jgi:hypothetical protein
MFDSWCSLTSLVNVRHRLRIWGTGTGMVRVPLRLAARITTEQCRPTISVTDDLTNYIFQGGFPLKQHRSLTSINPMVNDVYILLMYIYILAAQHVRQLVFTHRLGQCQASVVLAARVVEVRMVKKMVNDVDSPDRDPALPNPESNVSLR